MYGLAVWWSSRAGVDLLCRLQVPARLADGQPVVEEVRQPRANAVVVDRPVAEMLRQHLRAQANSEERLALAQRHADEVDLGLDEAVRIVGALRAAEDHGAGMLGHRGGQGLAETRATDIELVAAFAQRITDA